MNKMNHTSKRTTPPHVKWGSLIIAILFFIIGITPIILNILVAFECFPANLPENLEFAIALIAGYGWIITVIALMVTSAEFSEEFLPSLRAVKKWQIMKEKQRRERDLANVAYEKFLEEYFS